MLMPSTVSRGGRRKESFGLGEDEGLIRNPEQNIQTVKDIRNINPRTAYQTKLRTGKS